MVSMQPVGCADVIGGVTVGLEIGEIQSWVNETVAHLFDISLPIVERGPSFCMRDQSDLGRFPNQVSEFFRLARERWGIPISEASFPGDIDKKKIVRKIIELVEECGSKRPVIQSNTEDRGGSLECS